MTDFVKIEKSLDALQAKMKDALAAYADNINGLKSLKEQYLITNETIQVQGVKLEELQNGLKEIINLYGENSTQASIWQKQIDETSANIHQLSSNLMELESKTEGVGALKTRFEEIKSKSQDSGTAIGKTALIVKGLSDSVISCTQGLKSFGTALVHLGASGIQTVNEAVVLAGKGFSAYLKGIVDLGKSTVSSAVDVQASGGMIGDSFAQSAGQIALFTGQQQSLQNQFQMISATIGSAFIPALSTAMQSVTEQMPVIRETLTGIFSGDNSEGLSEGLTTGLVSAFTGAITGLAENLPVLLGNINTVLLSIFQAVGQTLPILVTTLLPVLITSFTSLVSGIVSQVPVLLPALLEGAIQLFTGLLNGLNLIIPQLMAMLPVLIQNVGALLIANLPIILDAGFQLLISLINGISNAIPELITQVTALIPVITNNLIENIPKLIDAGIELIVALATGLPLAIPDVLAAIPEIIAAIIDTFMNQNWLQIGVDILRGIAEGLINGVEMIVDKIKQAATSVLNKFKSFLGIHSPSKVFKDEVGKFLAEGLAIGFTDEMIKVQGKMVNAVPTEFPGAAVDSNYNKNLGAYIDYNKLTRCMIQGLGRSGLTFSVGDRQFARLVREVM